MIRKKSVKALLIILALISATVFCAGGMYLLESDNGGYNLLGRSDLTYENSPAFYGALENAVTDICMYKSIYYEENNASIHEYERLMSKYDEEESNLTFVLLLPETEEFFTNIREVHSYNRACNKVNNLRSTPWNIYMTEDNSKHTSSVELPNLYELNQIAGELQNRKFVLAISMEQGFPKADVFQQGRDTFNAVAKYIYVVLAAVAISAILTLASLVLLTLAAGRVPEDEEVHLNKFDHFYTEPSALLIMLIWVICIPVMEELFGYNNDKLLVIGASAFGFYSIFWFLIGYLS
ncbi:MAG: hypothetical protein KBT01_05625, partial [Clostridiales bacterium]|nr:hypothetical protein [Candidatus Blautia equi]